MPVGRDMPLKASEEVGGIVMGPKGEGEIEQELSISWRWTARSYVSVMSRWYPRSRVTSVQCVFTLNKYNSFIHRHHKLQ